MTAKFLIGTLMASALTLAPLPAVAADGEPLPATAPAQPVIYGSQLMTQQERMAYRSTMMSLKTQQERDAFRLEHHKLMQERAKAQGYNLPPEVPPAGGRMGPGSGIGPGGGMGPGGGSGRGMGRGMGPGGGMGPGMGAGPGANLPAR